MNINDRYKTITRASPEVLFKDRGSKFFGYAFPVTSEAKVKTLINDLKQQHHQARHWCYAYQFGMQEKDLVFRVNDDGEPHNSAGMPIYGQIQSFELTNILIVVVRYFGGTKLGVGGLINAYRTGAQMALNASKITTKTVNTEFAITFDYKHMNTVMRIIKEKQLKITEQILELRCKIIISVRLKKADAIFEIFDAIHDINIKKFNE